MKQSRSLTDEEQAHFEKCLAYTYRILALYEVFYMYAVYKVDISAEISSMSAYAYTDGKKVVALYPAILEASEEEFAGIMLHEFIHIFNLHVIRKKERNHFMWNIACDININGSIRKDYKLRYNKKINVRDNMIFSPSVEHLSAEQIYDKLIHNEVPNFRVYNLDKEGMRVETQNENGKWVPLEYEPDFKEGEEQGEAHKQLVRESRSAYGNMSEGIDRIVTSILDTPHVDWRKELRKYITKNVSDYSFSVRDRRFVSSPFFVPGMEESPNGSLKIKVGIDLSGSVSDKDISRMISECVAIEKQFTSVQFEFIPFDVRTYGNFKAKNKEEIVEAFKKFKGGGGTSFVQVLSELDTKDAIVILMFTDLLGTFPKSKPKTDVIWVDIGDYAGVVPFGKKVNFR